jgi:hypothetical protein
MTHTDLTEVTFPVHSDVAPHFPTSAVGKHVDES